MNLLTFPRTSLFGMSGYPAVTLIESSTPWRDSQNYNANPFYHTFRDTVDKINFRLVTKVTQLSVSDGG